MEDINNIKITVVIPVLNEEKTIVSIIEICKAHHYVDEVLVIDDGSVDNTLLLSKKAGANVEISTMRGKGASIEDGIWRSRNKIILFIDGDFTALSSEIIDKMIEPLIKNDQLTMTKANFERQAGRVTELTAKPLLTFFFPELHIFKQPLSGIYAIRKENLKHIPIEKDYGVDIGILIDLKLCGSEIIEVEVGKIEHKMQSLEGLSVMSHQVARTILQRADNYKRLNNTHIEKNLETGKNNLSSMESWIKTNSNNCKKLVLLDMDMTITLERFIVSLAKRVNKTDELFRLLDRDVTERSKKICQVFQGVEKQAFEHVAEQLQISPKIKEFCIELKRRNYSIGIISDSYHVATEIVRKRIFADFSIAHSVYFSQKKCTGDLVLAHPFLYKSEHSCHHNCKGNVIDYICEHSQHKVEEIIVIGDGPNDVCMAKKSHKSFSVNSLESVAENFTFNYKCIDDVLSHFCKNEF